MKDLARDNILRIEPYRPGKPIEELRRELGIEGEIVKLASNENPLGPSSLALTAIRESLTEAGLYPDDGCYYLKQRLAQHLGVTWDNLTVGSGTTELIRLIATAFLNIGESLIMSKPSFLMAKLAALVMDCHLVEIPLKKHRHDLLVILDQIDDNTKLIYIDNPINPIGTMITADEVLRFMEEIPSTVGVIFDEAYYEYIDREDYPNTLDFVKEERNVIVLRTFSKIYGLAGLRIGYGIAKEELIEVLEKTRAPFSVNRLAQIGALAALEDAGHVRRTREVTEKGRIFLYRNLERMSIPYIPSVTNFVTIDVRRDAFPVYEQLQREGVIVRPLREYDQPTSLRVTIGTEEQNRRFIQALERVYHATGNT